ncbi:hypothetical protein ABT214_27105 [Micromonospora purpureochromogenes]|uniref:hypothetical protein n=1 Tax=Micromonospora purpureochromogenes TaxID=47872 RepID=UPI0033290DE7
MGRLRHVGGRHAADSTVVLVRRLLDDRYHWYVSSHADPITLDETRAAAEG